MEEPDPLYIVGTKFGPQTLHTGKDVLLDVGAPVLFLSFDSLFGQADLFGYTKFSYIIPLFFLLNLFLDLRLSLFNYYS